MQPPTDGPRSGYTVAQVQYLIENTSSFDTTMGVELLTDDMTLAVEEDISDFVTAASVTRNSLANLHAQLTVSLSRRLNWGRSILRPYMTMTGPTSPTSGLTTMKFYRGAYFADTPEEDLSELPANYDVTGYDILSILDDSVGDTFSIDVGVNYLATVEEILTNRGVTQYVIDRDAADRTVSSPIVYMMEDNVTWLSIVNDLLAGVGYQGVWSDWNGMLRCHTYTTPTLRSPEWLFDVNIANTLLTQRRRIQHDFYNAPNRWVFYRTNNTDGPPPADGDGRWEYVNETVGETSVEARGGRTITRTVGLDVSDHASLVAAGQSIIDADMAVPTTIPMETAPFPLAWHFDKYVVSDPALGAALDVLATAWTQNLDGSDMQHEWSIP